jgi:bifunctional enzyme CysN/CysC
VSAGPDVTWHAGAVDAAFRARAAGRRGVTVWLTGLSGAGKSTIAVAAERAIVGLGIPALRLDGDNLRHGLNADLGFDAAGRAEAVRRAGEAALLLAESGAVALVAMISPYQADRDRVRARHAAAGVRFLEVHVDASLATAERRDPKGLYAKARRGELKGFTGIDDPYEAPASPELRLRTDAEPLERGVAALLEAIAASARA